jgi:hypothetical protein
LTYAINFKPFSMLQKAKKIQIDYAWMLREDKKLIRSLN